MLETIRYPRRPRCVTGPCGQQSADHFCYTIRLWNGTAVSVWGCQEATMGLLGWRSYSPSRGCLVWFYDFVLFSWFNCKVWSFYQQPPFSNADLWWAMVLQELNDNARSEMLVSSGNQATFVEDIALSIKLRKNFVTVFSRNETVNSVQ